MSFPKIFSRIATRWNLSSNLIKGVQVGWPAYKQPVSANEVFL